MNIETLNDKVNDLAVLRIEIAAIEEERQKIIEAHEVLKELEISMEGKRAEKDKLQQTLLEIMREADLKAWKTPKVTISRALRTSLTIDPLTEAPFKTRLINGEKIDGFLLRQTEYISVRTNPIKK